MDEKTKKYIEDLKKTLNDLKNKYPSNKKEIANKTHAIGGLYFDLARYDDALDYYSQSLELQKQMLPSNHPDIAVSLSNIGNVYYKQMKYEEALNYYNQSLKIRKEALSLNHPDIATSLNNIGKVYLKELKYEEALNYFNQALEIGKQALPSNHPTIALALNNIGKVYYSEMKYEEALNYYNRSLEMRKNSLPSNHSDIALSLNCIGSVYKHRKKYKEALKHYNQGLEIYKQKKSTIKIDIEITRTLNNIGNVHYEQREFEDALNYYNQSLEIRKKTLPSNHRAIAVSLNNIGEVYFNEMKYEEALNYLKDERLRRECLKEINKKDNLLSPRVEVMEDYFIERTFLNRYRTEAFLGRGGFGKVYKIADKNDLTREKAMKILEKNNTSENELELIMSVNHENVVRYYDHFELIKGGTKYLCIITEFCHNGDLSKRIAEKKKLNDREIFTWTFQVVKGLKYLHLKGIIHRDIKPENILLNKDDVVKLGDLGIAKLTEATIHADTFAGSRPYMSPEILACENHDMNYSFKTDIWSLGCVIYEMMFFEKAFPRGPGMNPVIPDLGDSLIFRPILKKVLVKNTDIRIDSTGLYDYLLKVHGILDLDGI